MKKIKLLVSLIIIFAMSANSFCFASDNSEEELTGVEEDCNCDVVLGEDLLTDINPSIYNMKITGIPALGETLTFNYEIDDPCNKEADPDSKISWKLQTKPFYTRYDNQNKSDSLKKGTRTFKIPFNSDFVGKYISVDIPVAGVVTGYRTMGVGPIVSSVPSKPWVTSVAINTKNGVGADVGETLVGTYMSVCNVPIKEEKYQWYAGSNEQDLNSFTPIEGANEKEFTIPDNLKNMYIKLGVTCVSENGTEGNEQKSMQSVLVGNVAYGAYSYANVLPGDTFSYAGSSLSVLTNGITDRDAGGAIMTYAGKTDVEDGIIIVDLGRERVINEVRVTITGTSKDKIMLKKSVTGACDSFEPIKLDYDNSEQIVVPSGQAKRLKFSNNEKLRYLMLNYTRFSNIQISEIEAISVEDNKPVIDLLGDNPLKLLKGEKFAEPGFVAMDKEDGEITDNVVVSGNVDVDKVGSYELVYEVTDSKPQTVKAVRTVEVANGYKKDGDLAYNAKVDEKYSEMTDGNDFTFDSMISPEGSFVLDLGDEQKVSKLIVLEEEKNIEKIVAEVSLDGKEFKKVGEGKEVLSFVPVTTRYIKFKYISKINPKINTIEVYFDNMGKLTEVAENLKITDNPTHIKDDLALPVNGKYGSEITWHSDNSKVIDKNGVVKRPSNRNENVKLTAKITLQDESLTKEFDLTVLKREKKSGGSGGSGSGNGGFVSVPKPKDDINLPTPPQYSCIFKDVTGSHWAKTYIEDLYKSGIVNGRGEDLFEPDEYITRSEFLKLVIEAAGIQVSSDKVVFTDVLSGEWCYPYISTAYNMGIVKGLTPEIFGAEQFITRQDMAVITMNAIGAIGNKLEEKIKEEYSFADYEDISDYAKESVEILRKSGIVKGNNLNEFSPYANATRAECAKLIWNIKEVCK